MTIATDASAEQIAAAPKLENVEYRIALAERSGLSYNYISFPGSYAPIFPHGGALDSRTTPRLFQQLVSDQSLHQSEWVQSP